MRRSFVLKSLLLAGLAAIAGTALAQTTLLLVDTALESDQMQA